MATPQHIIKIIRKRLERQSLSKEERMQMKEWLNLGSDEEVLFTETAWEKDLSTYFQLDADDQQFSRALQRFRAAAGIVGQVADNGAAATTPMTSHPARRVHFIRKWWWAAASILVIGTTIALLLTTHRKQLTTEITVVKNDSADVVPGTNRALLTIGTNKAIDLSKNKTGISVGAAITYNDGERIADASQALQLVTPRGGQYQAVLPDGTKVWLNAESSIRFPSKFPGDKREVEVSGEVYMEVAQDAKSPFSVTAGKAIIQVLGTSFNVNAYPEEATQKTTLVSGSVKVLVAGRSVNSKQAEVLKPGQQAIVAGESIKVNKADIEQALAWKNGFFNMQDATLQQVMHQLERWYDIKVKYEGKMIDDKFQGEVSRREKLSFVLEWFSSMGINSRFDGKVLVLSAK